jgi:two-component system sensor histidine kinase BarA
MDLQLPGMDGRQVTQAIRLLDGCHDLPIIALTADGLKESQQRCLQAGMNACLIKPITLEQLAATIRTWTQSEDIPVLSPNEDQMTGLVMPLHKLAEFAGDAAAKNLGKELQDSLPEWRESLDSAMLASDKQQVHRVVHRLLGSSSLWHHPELLTLLKKIDSEQFSQLDTTLRNSMLDQYFADIHLAVSKYITA